MSSNARRPSGPVRDPDDKMPSEKSVGDRSAGRQAFIYPTVDENSPQNSFSQKQKNVGDWEAMSRTCPSPAHYSYSTASDAVQRQKIMDEQRARARAREVQGKLEEQRRGSVYSAKSTASVKEGNNGNLPHGQIENEIDLFELDLHRVVCCAAPLVPDHRPKVTREEFSRIVAGYKGLLNKPTTSATTTTNPPYLFSATLSPSGAKKPYIFMPDSPSPRITPLMAAPPIPWDTKPTLRTSSLFSPRTTFTSPRTRPLTTDRSHGRGDGRGHKHLVLPTPSAKLMERKWEKINQRDRERERHLAGGQDWARGGGGGGGGGDESEERTEDQDWVRVHRDEPLGGAYTLL